MVMEHLPRARKVANRLARAFPPVEADDVYQELSILLITKADTIAEFYEKYDKPEAVLDRVLWRWGVPYCRKERQERLHFTDEYFYTPEDVKGMLPYWFEYDNWDEAHVPDDGDFLSHDPRDMMLDLSRCYYLLTENNQQVLRDSYHPAYRVEDGSDSWRSRRTRAVNSLVQKMNQYKSEQVNEYEGPGSREVLNIKQAWWETHGPDDGGSTPGDYYRYGS